MNSGLLRPAISKEAFVENIRGDPANKRRVRVTPLI